MSTEIITLPGVTLTTTNDRGTPAAFATTAAIAAVVLVVKSSTRPAAVNEVEMVFCCTALTPGGAGDGGGNFGCGDGEGGGVAGGGDTGGGDTCICMIALSTALEISTAEAVASTSSSPTT